MQAYMDSECTRCFGFGLVLPRVNPLAEDAEMELCRCRGTGRMPKLMATGGFNNLVAAMALSEGWAFRTRQACLDFITANYE